jgi:hypothetical protein
VDDDVAVIICQALGGGSGRRAREPREEYGGGDKGDGVRLPCGGVRRRRRGSDGGGGSGGRVMHSFTSQLT